MLSVPPGGQDFDSSVNLETLNRLLSRQAEAPDLDFKSTLDLSSPRDVVELAKDVAAMAVNGCYLVVGADDSGSLTGGLSSEAALLLDEARLRGKLKKWLPDDLGLAAGRHVVEGKTAAVIVVSPYHEGMVVMRADGQYPDGSSSKTVFRAGDVFARHGTASERMQQNDLRRIVRRLVDTERESWREDVLSSLTAAATDAGVATRIASAPAATLNFQLPVTAFRDTVVEQVRHGDLAPLRLLLLSAGKLIEQALLEPDPTLPHTDLLDRICTVAALGVVLDDDTLFSRALEALGVVYRSGLDTHGHARSDLLIPPQQLWLDCLVRIEAVGALCVRLRDWTRAKRLAMHGPQAGEMEYYGNWHRHALTEAARRNLLQVSEPGQARQLSVLMMASELVATLEPLHPDVAAGSDSLLDSLAQYDVLAGLFGMDAGGAADGKHYYPNAAKLEARRALPILEGVVKDSGLRSEFVANDAQLASYLKAFIEQASRESAWGWHVPSESAVLGFINANHA